MHANNIVHRDLKPGNCLLDDKFQLNIIDFGLAIESKSSTGSDGMLLGTPLFMAPEIFTSRGAIDSYKEPVDIWACGIIMYYLISNTFPFYDDDRHVLEHEICTQPVIFSNATFKNSDSKPAQDLITKMLAKNPIQRI